MNKPETQDIQAAEEKFKQRLLELGLLTRITPPPTAGTMPGDRQPVAVSGNAVSEIIMKERR
jgi:hypothetical protein